jgi:hypothetical protein
MNIPKEVLERIKKGITEENQLLDEMKTLIEGQLHGLKVNIPISRQFNFRKRKHI